MNSSVNNNACTLHAAAVTEANQPLLNIATNTKQTYVILCEALSLVSYDDRAIAVCVHIICLEIAVQHHQHQQ
jgi:hypothetical protein